MMRHRFCKILMTLKESNMNSPMPCIGIVINKYSSTLTGLNVIYHDVALKLIL
jgi:hypothetical protein